MKEELVSVFTVSDPVTAEIVKNFLEGEDIRAFIENENQAGFQALSSLAIRILVPSTEAERARKLIEKHEPHKKHR